jgi:D-alanine-D-alanine ligase-like ATP-grasp enzyme
MLLSRSLVTPLTAAAVTAAAILARARSTASAAAAAAAIAGQAPRQQQQQQQQRAAKRTVVLVDPLTDWRDVLQAVVARDWAAVVVWTNLLPTRDDLAPFTPSTEALLAAGAAHVYTTPTPVGFDVYACTQHLRTLAQRGEGMRYVGVVPLGEIPVEYSDTLAALLGVRTHNALASVLARREKGFMKDAVAAAGLRTARYARLTSASGDDVAAAVARLGLSYPVVVKTPHGFSTTDVYVCEDGQEAARRAAAIVGSVGPDCRVTQSALLEEFLGGEEFACNMVASPGFAGGGAVVTDVWRYGKSLLNGTARYDRADMVDPADPAAAAVCRYAEAVAAAVGIEHGMGHVELKARWCAARGAWVDPTLIEVGARFSGGRKSILTRDSVRDWDPFAAILDAHCGLPVAVPAGGFSPHQFVRHLFLPNVASGRVAAVRGADFARLKTHHSSFVLAKPGATVRRTTDIVTCAGFVWLAGERADVDADTESALAAFAVEVEPEE